MILKVGKKLKQNNITIIVRVFSTFIIKINTMIIPGGWENRVLLWIHKNSGPNKLQVP